ncbi:uncharacterized protein PG998_013899 [Apiospora kogelbergensis]|uniref:Uncharacterized protein n=1 Tax=Apiospora kogelbergensis TaxID=1337665 RepID=A0AAW0R004_9PEZI
MSSSIAAREPGAEQAKEETPAGNHGADAAAAPSRNRSQTLSILIFRGRPEDTPAARITDLYVAASDDSNTNSTFRLDGRPGSYRAGELPNLAAPRLRPDYRSQIHVATLPATSVAGTSLHDTIKGVVINNDDPSWGCQHWVGDVVMTLHELGIITEDEGDRAIDAMMNIILAAPR